MPAVQTTYSGQHARWIEGFCPSMEQSNTITRIAEDAEGIGFGKVVVAGSTDELCVDSETTVAFLGIAEIDTTRVTGKYEQYENVAIRNRGPIVVQASEAVAIGDPVYYTPATGVLSKTASGNTLIAGAIWATSTTTSGLAVIRLK